MAYQKKREGDYVNRVYRYKLKLRKSQIALLEDALKTQRFLYNRVLEHRTRQYDARQDAVTRVETNLRNCGLSDDEIGSVVKRIKSQLPMDGLGDLKKKFITAGRKSDAYLASAGYGICARTLTRLDNAFKNFFDRAKKGERGGYPKFKGCYAWNTLEYDSYGNGCSVVGNRVILQNIGSLKFLQYRDMPDDSAIRNLSITRTAGGWFVNLILEIPFIAPEKRQGEPVGIDMGLREFITASDGRKWKPSRYMLAMREKLANAQRALESKVKGSTRRRKAVRRVTKLHLRAQSQRKEWHRKIAKEIVLRYPVIAREELDIRSMIIRPDPIPGDQEGEFLPNGAAQMSNLHKLIADSGWGTFFMALDSAAERFGATVKTVPAAYTSQFCADCGTKQEPPIDVLRNKMFKCLGCGKSEDLHYNAARNIKSMAYA